MNGSLLEDSVATTSQREPFALTKTIVWEWPGVVPAGAKAVSASANNEIAPSTDAVIWSKSASKRAFDFAVASTALVALSPVMLVTAAVIKVSSPGPVLFRQSRMGMDGRCFTIYKFRTMSCDAQFSGPSVTKAGDKRLTAVGGFLRKWKLDEIPQLINVMRGDMSLVGPRPKVPRHQTHQLEVRPGITGAATLAFRREEYVLHRVPENRLDEYQVQVLMPVKRALDDRYTKTATFASDLGLMFRTVFGRGEAVDSEGLYNLQHSLISLQTALHNANFITTQGEAYTSSS